MVDLLSAENGDDVGNQAISSFTSASVMDRRKFTYVLLLTFLLLVVKYFCDAEDCMIADAGFDDLHVMMRGMQCGIFLQEAGPCLCDTFSLSCTA